MPQILNNLSIREVSSVDRGAGEGVQIVLMKRDFTDDERKRVRSNGLLPIKNAEDLKSAIQTVDRTKNPSATKAHIVRCAKTMGCTDMLPGGWLGKSVGIGDIEILEKIFNVSKNILLAKADDEKFVTAVEVLALSVESITKADVGSKAKADAIVKTCNQFVDHVAGFAPEVATAMTQGANLMATLKEQMDKVFGDGGTADNKDALRKEFEGNVAALETSKSALETANKALETEVGVWKTRVKASIGLEKVAKDYVNHSDNTMSEEETCKFLDMSEPDRAEYIKVHPIEVMTQKRIEALPEPVRKQLEEGQRASEQVMKMQEERDIEAFSKRAAELGQPTEFGNHLRLLSKGLGTIEERTAAFDAVTKALEAGVAQSRAAGLFKEFGSGQRGGSGSANDELVAKATELRETVNKSNNAKPMTQEQAFAKVYTDPANRELVLRSKTEKGSVAA